MGWNKMAGAGMEALFGGARENWRNAATNSGRLNPVGCASTHAHSEGSGKTSACAKFLA